MTYHAALKKLFLGLGISLTSLVLATVILEFSLRFTNPGQLVIFRTVPRVGTGRAPNQKGVFYGNDFEGEWVAMTINAKGLRGDEIPDVKAHDELRVLALGDSFVFGGGLADENTFPAICQRTCGYPATRVRFINAGGNGYDTREAASFLELNGVLLQPDVVVLGWNWNDLVSILGPVSNFPMAPEWIRRFAIYKFWQYHKSPREWKKTSDEDFQKYHNDVIYASSGSDSPQRWEAAQAALMRLIRACKKMRAKFFVLVMPELTWMESPKFPGLDKLTSFLNSLGIPWTDCQPQFYEAFQKSLHVTQTLDSFHPSAEGQALMARILLQALWERNWIPRKP